MATWAMFVIFLLCFVRLEALGNNIPYVVRDSLSQTGTVIANDFICLEFTRNLLNMYYYIIT